MEGKLEEEHGREKESQGWYWSASTCIETRYWFSFFFSNGKKCIVRPKEISMGIWGKRSWNEHPVHRCLLWIVYRAVVIELSEQGPSPICALLRVFGLSMYLCNISDFSWGRLRKARKVLWETFQRSSKKELFSLMLFMLLWISWILLLLSL